MKVVKTMLIIGVSVGAGLVVANYLTDGAVFEAASNIFTNAKDSIMNKSQDVAETVTNVAEDVVEVASEAM